MYLKLFEVRTAKPLPEVEVIYLQLYKSKYPKFSLWSRPVSEFYGRGPDVSGLNTRKGTVARYKKLSIKEIVLWILNRNHKLDNLVQ